MRSRLLPPAFLAAILLGVYGATLAPGLTWSHSGVDGGDLITATATGGVPHPTGYPLYLLLAGFFQRLPIGPLAFRTNLLSALTMTGAALMVYLLVERFFSGADRRVGALAGLASAFSFALAPLVWSQAVITEVYALHMLLVSAILFLSSGGITGLSESKQDWMTGLMLGPALSNHLTAILLLPVVFVPVILNFKSLGRRALFLLLGLLPYLILPIRAASHPPINWGDASTWDGFLWLVSGRLYQGSLLALTFPGFVERVQASGALLMEQFNVVALPLAFLGAVMLPWRSRLQRNMLWTVTAFSMFSILYATRDWQLYLLPVFLCFAIWIGIALGSLMSKWPAGRIWIVGLFAVSLIFSAAQTWPHVDLSRDTQAEEYGASLLAQLPPDAIVFARTDEVVFSLWYFHFALGERPDVVIVAADLLHFDWYQQTLRAAYPALVVPGPLPFDETVRQANPSRPACYVASPRVLVDCIEMTP